MNKKFLSVIIPCYNNEKTIVRTMSSLITNLDYINEIIVVNDCSNDHSIEVVSKFANVLHNIKVVHNSHRSGPGVSRKVGILESQSEWITCIDADDAITLSSLQYVYDCLQINPEILLLNTRMMYFESGSFDESTVEYGITSCGGNFYNRRFLLDNNLLPHDTLMYSEDEYFNRKILKYLEIYYPNQEIIYDLDYPVYQVFHDKNIRSYSFDNWGNYLCSSHLLCSKYYIEDFISYTKEFENLKREALQDFIFCYFLLQTLDDDYAKYLKDFKDYYIFLQQAFYVDVFNIRSFYYDNYDLIEELKNGAILSGGDLINSIEFVDFLILLDDSYLT